MALEHGHQGMHGAAGQWIKGAVPLVNSHLEAGLPADEERAKRRRVRTCSGTHPDDLDGFGPPRS